MIRLFREIEGDTGGGTVFNIEKINAQLKTIQDVSNEAYNKGVDHTLELVEAWWKERLPNITQLKERIESLKKK